MKRQKWERSGGLRALACLLLTLASTLPALGLQATLQADAHVSSAQPAVNAGSLSNLNVGGGFTAFMQFDLGPLPAGVTAGQIARATLRLYCNRADTPGTVAVQTVGSSWGEYSVTYAGEPTLGAAVATGTVSAAGGFVTFDVTSAVQAWVGTPANNNGLALASTSAVVQFDSKENDVTSHAPELEIALTAGGTGSGAAGATGTTGATGVAGVTGATGPQGLPGTAAAKGATGATGVTGATGIAGANGVTGATGSTGAAGAGAFVFQGAYNSATNYAQGDVATFGGSSYVSLAASNHGNTPGLSTGSWGLLALGGNGVLGATGATGTTGAMGATGAAGIGFVGPYSSVTNYSLGDTVSYGGSSWLSLTASNHGNTPGLTTGSWGLLAAAGATGATGVAGATGTTGQQGPVGFGIQGSTGGTGATGNTGSTGPAGMIYRGDYSSVTNYIVGDVVLFSGASWVSLQSFNHGQTPSFSPLYWGVLTAQGPIGLTGAQGATGVTGVQGAPGSVGPPGERGDQGLQGIAGQAGAQGIPGVAGATGLQGPMGPQGVAGPTGLSFQGAYSSAKNYALADGVLWQGAGWVSLVANNHGNTPDQSPGQWLMFAAMGAVGPVGVTGTQGAVGATGAIGAAGPTGATGSVGATGATGQGLNMAGVFASSTNYGVGDVVSYGNASYVSRVASNHGQTPGLSPDSWMQLAAQGAAGVTGATGLAGAAGAVGATGALGATGAQGPPVSFAGAWIVGQTYATGAAVSYLGSSYVALSANVGRQPSTSPLYWTLLAAGGATGVTGSSGSTGVTGAQGVQGPAGVAGSTGVTGSTGSSGRAGLAWQGAWGAAVAYAVNDGVSYGGSTYIAIAANSGQQPASFPAIWSLLAAAGTAGSNGAVGTTGSTGLTGAAGVTGATGAIGPTGLTGSPGVNFRGAWSQTKAYALNDDVTFAGSTYLALAANSGQEPDLTPQVWGVLAQSGGAGATGATGVAATVTIGSVTTLAAGSQATVTNSGSAQTAVLNFAIPQGATGSAGSGAGTGATSSNTFAAVYHPVTYTTLYYSINSPAAAATETDAVLAWIPKGCTATRLDVISHQSGPVRITLRSGAAASSMADTALVCTPAVSGSCPALGSVAIPAGSFTDLKIEFASGTSAGVWTALECDP